MDILRAYIKLLIESDHDEKEKEDKDDNLLLEPDYTEERGEEEAQEEMSSVGAGGGALAPSGNIVGHTGGNSKKYGKNRFGKRNYANFKKKKK
tara:strand:+ start:109 stop:387 length:279 start_codon:yes stop_codon:yes gene_type:complete